MSGKESRGHLGNLETSTYGLYSSSTNTDVAWLRNHQAADVVIQIVVAGEILNKPEDRSGPYEPRPKKHNAGVAPGHILPYVA